VPVGFETSDAALAFSPDGARFAFVSGRKAKLWDLATGGVQQWSLPPGLLDTLAFDAAGKRLLLCRVETADGIAPPFGAESRGLPRVCRIRDLLGPEPTKELARIDLKHRPVWLAASPDAGFFVLGEEIIPENGLIRVLAGSSGKEIFSARSRPGFLLDPTGKVLVLPFDGGGCPLLEMPSGKLLATWDSCPANCVGPGGRYWTGQASSYGFHLGRGADPVSLVTLAIDSQVTNAVQFSDDGRLLAWGKSDGAVQVGDINEVQHKLAELGLGWE
jgi:WD40 repeat protein